MSKEKLNLSVGLEIGTTKVAMVVAKEIRADGLHQTLPHLEVLSAAQAPHKGVYQGLIVDNQEIIFALQKVKAEIEIVAGQAIDTVTLTVADLSLETIQTKGMISIKKMIHQRDVDAVIQSAKENAQVRSDREVLHAFPLSFKTEGQRHDQAPLKVKSASLEATVLLITVSRKNIQAAKDCLKAVGLQVRDVVAPPVASAYAVTLAEDRQQGIAVIDMGGSLTHIAAFKNGNLSYASSVALGGANFTQDLAVGLRTPQAAAEKIKKTHGAALVDLVSPEEVIEIDSLKNEPARQIPARLVSEILEARSEETLGLLLRKLNDEDLLSSLKRGVLLTGGASQLPGLPELGEFTFDIPLRRGETPNITNGAISVSPQAQSPVMSAALGLLQYSRGTQGFVSSDISLNTFKDSFRKFKNIIDNIL